MYSKNVESERVAGLYKLQRDLLRQRFSEKKVLQMEAPL
jgi:hypothetical protein